MDCLQSELSQQKELACKLERTVQRVAWCLRDCCRDLPPQNWEEKLLGCLEEIPDSKDRILSSVIEVKAG